jgi:integrase
MPIAARKIVLKDSSLKALKPAPAGKRATVWDALMPNLAVRVTDKGRRSFYTVARRAGDSSPTWHLLGVYPAMTLAEARTAAREALNALLEGKHPKRLAEEKRKAADAAARDAVANTFGSVAEDFIRYYLPTIKSARVYEARVRRELIPALGTRPIAEIRRREIIALLKGIAERSGAEAARGTLVVLSRLLNWAVAQDLPGFEANPTASIKAGDTLGKAKARNRLLSDVELAAIWRATDSLSQPFAGVYRLLLLTGARREEIAAARWEDLDLDAATLTIPAERAKNGEAMLIPLPPAAVALLATIRRFAGPFIFSTTAGRRPLGAFSQAKGRLDAAIAAQGATVTPFVVHDFRRAVRSGLGRLGVPAVVAELCLGHRQRGIAGVYDRHSYLDEKRDALRKWEAHLLGVVAPPAEGGNIVALPARA